MVTEMLTSDVLTTSIAVRQRSKTSNTRRRNPCAISMRVDVMSTTVMWRLQASAASGSSTGELPVMSVPPPSNLRLFRILTGIFFATAGRMVLVQHLRTEVRQLRSLLERQSRHHVRRFHDAGIGGHHAVDIGPDLDFAGVERRPKNRRRVVRSAPPERGRDAPCGRPDVAANDRHLTRRSERRETRGDGGRRFSGQRQRRAERVVGHQHLSRIHPDGGQAGGPARRFDDPAAQQLSERRDRVARARRCVLQRPDGMQQIAKLGRFRREYSQSASASGTTCRATCSCRCCSSPSPASTIFSSVAAAAAARLKSRSVTPDSADTTTTALARSWAADTAAPACQSPPRRRLRFHQISAPPDRNSSHLLRLRRFVAAACHGRHRADKQKRRLCHSRAGVGCSSRSELSDHAQIHTAGLPGFFTRFREPTADAHVQEIICAKVYKSRDPRASTPSRRVREVTGSGVRANARIANPRHRMIRRFSGCGSSPISRRTTPRVWLTIAQFAVPIDTERADVSQDRRTTQFRRVLADPR